MGLIFDGREYEIEPTPRYKTPYEWIKQETGIDLGEDWKQISWEDARKIDPNLSQLSHLYQLASRPHLILREKK